MAKPTRKPKAGKTNATRRHRRYRPPTVVNGEVIRGDVEAPEPKPAKAKPTDGDS